ncbi:MAG: hypothetical protein A2X22_01480 [Bacteroidetes bacterium GWF2_49_14]|nr:MAG: hypothetical protein A2X22_01480 [Bacteroidetes bacterium GWF2_49_14]HBB93171.1 hypothetical protein [Bacteroidales bacterium]
MTDDRELMIDDFGYRVPGISYWERGSPRVSSRRRPGSPVSEQLAGDPDFRQDDTGEPLTHILIPDTR